MNLFYKFIKIWGRGRSEEVVSSCRKAAKVAQYVGVLPYSWNDEKQVLEFSKSRTHFAIFVTQYLMYLMYEGFIIYRWMYASDLDSTATAKDKIALQYVAISYGALVLNHSCSFFNRGSLHNLINRLLHFIRNDFQRLPTNGMKQRNFGKIIRIIPCVAVVVISLNVSTVFRKPMSPHLLTSLLHDVTKWKKWELIPFAVIHGYIWCNQWASIYFYTTFYMSHISAIQNALNRTRPCSKLSGERFFSTTRKLEVLQGNFNALIRWVLWVSVVILSTICVFGICGSIWSEGAQAMRIFVVSMFTLGMLLKFWKELGGVYETSSEVLAEWRERSGFSLVLRKRMKSVRPIRVQIGGYFYADASMTLTLLTIISENTFNVLLAA